MTNDYYFEKAPGSGPEYKITKMDPESEAFTIYHINVNKKFCSCPAYKYPCKHVEMIMNWGMIEDKEKYYYDGAAGRFQLNPMADNSRVEGILGGN